MNERFDRELDRLWNDRHDAAMETQHAELKELMTHPKEMLDSVSYVKIMYLMGKYYEKQGNSNASRYCAMRIFMVLDCIKHKYRKRPRFLKFQEVEPDEEIIAFLKERLAFLAQTYRFIQTRLWMLLGVICVVEWLIVWQLGVSLWLNTLFSVLLFLFGYFLLYRRLKDRFHDRQTKALLPYIEEELKEFDRPILYG